MEYPLTLSVPVLHRELSAAVFSEAMHVCPGLAQAEEAGYARLDWPLSAEKARLFLRDAASLADSGLSPESTRVVRETDRQMSRRIRENRELRDILRQEGASAVKEDEQQARIQAQQVLLMAWLQEERLMELEALSRRADATAARLTSLLDDGTDTAHNALFALHTVLDLRLLPSWQTVLEHLAVFLPSGTVLASCDPQMTEFLSETGALSPVPERPHCQQGTLPLWRAIGLSRAQRERPWLDALHTFIFCEETIAHV